MAHLLAVVQVVTNFVIIASPHYDDYGCLLTSLLLEFHADMKSPIIEIVNATRRSETEFWKDTALGISLTRLAKDLRLQAHIAFENRSGLPEVFNTRIDAPSEADILVFIRDDVWINDESIADRIIDGLHSFDVIGLAGNRRRLQKQPSWAYVDDKSTWDESINLSGRVEHGPKPPGQQNLYGVFPDECELLDGVFLAAAKSTLINTEIRFDQQFDFHFYDLDFCRSAREKKLRLGTWPMGLTCQSSSTITSQSWRDAYQLYVTKWQAPDREIALRETALSFEYRFWTDQVMATNQEKPKGWIKKILSFGSATKSTVVSNDSGDGSHLPPKTFAKCEGLKNRGNDFLGQGKLDDAAQCYREALAIYPRYAAGLVNLAFVLGEQVCYDEAEIVLREAILIDPTLVDAFYILGTISKERGNVNGAIENFDKVLRLKPDFEIAYRDLCQVLVASGQPASARKVIEQGIALNPDSADFHYYLGNVCLATGDWGQAILAFGKALSIQPDYAEVHSNLALVLIQADRVDDALDHYRKALVINPADPELHAKLGTALQSQGKLDAAVRSFHTAQVLAPDSAQAHANLAGALQAQGKLEEAADSYYRALALDPKYFAVHINLGTTLQARGQLDAAAECYRAGLLLQPESAEARVNLGNVLRDQGRLDDALSSFREALTLKPSLDEGYTSLLFCLNYHPDISAEAIFAEYRNWNTLCALPLASAGCEVFNDSNPTRRLRIGYVSPDLRQHAVRHFIEPLLAHHDKSRVEVFAYAEIAIGDSVTARLKTYFDQWRDTVGLSDDQMAEMIRHDQIDILVDLAGHTANNRLLVFARRSAPIQVSWMGYGYTTGLDAMDYLVADSVFAPPGSESLFSEKLMRLPVWAVYRPDDDMGAPGPLPALNAQRITFGSLSRSVRINYRVIRVWASILQRVPTADLVINSGSFRTVEMQTAMRDQFVAHGIAPERVIVGFDSPAWHVLQKIDIGLDCFPHNSGTTLFESLHMGVPFITLADRPSVGRIGASILTAVGHPEWIADSEDDYVAKAVALASDTSALMLLRSGLRTQMKTSRLMNESAFAASVEDAYRTAWLERIGSAEDDNSRPMNPEHHYG